MFVRLFVEAESRERVAGGRRSDKWSRCAIATRHLEPTEELYLRSTAIRTETVLKDNEKMLFCEMKKIFVKEEKTLFRA